VAICKFNGKVSSIRLVKVENGGFKATVNVSAEPYMFWGPSAPTELAATAKLQFTVIKYVNTCLGYAIFDLHYSLRL
jgi:hypothetical protein